jgi:hypothetical protein
METEKSQSPKPNSDITKHDFLIDPQRNDEKNSFLSARATKQNATRRSTQDGEMNHNLL